MPSPPRRPGILHTYQKYDPLHFPSPTAPPPDVVSDFMEHLLRYGSVRSLTPDELARAVRLDPRQIAGLGPSLDFLRAVLEERKRRILATYETATVQRAAHDAFHGAIDPREPSSRFAAAYHIATREEQLHELEQLFDRIGDDTHPFARHVMRLLGHLARKYEVDELAARYAFTGRQSLSIDEALEIKELLEKIDELLKKLDEAEQTAQIGILDLDEFSEFVDETHLQQLQEMQRMIENYLREEAERQGLEQRGGRWQLSPQAMRVFQSKLLARIFADLRGGRSGRHRGTIAGEGAIELPQTRPYVFGDSIGNLDAVQTLLNALIRDPQARPPRFTSEDLAVHRTRNTPQAASVVVMDMSGSMRYDGLYVDVKRMALALDGLIRSEFPGDHLSFVEMFTFARVRRPGDIVDLMPRPVTLFHPLVRLKIDMSRPEVSEHMVHQHFTNLQHALRLARQLLAGQPAANKQILVITDGLPTAHFDGHELFLLYPPHPRTEEATLREARLCRREGITLNLFLIPSWNQSEDDVRFAYRLAEGTRGRVFFTAGRDLDRFVVWDYLAQRRDILG